MQSRKKISTLLHTLMIVGILLLIRLYYTHTLTYFFLVWNLILAYVPLVVSNAVLKYSKRWIIVSGTIIWLLFFPNACYILSDIIHIRQLKGVPVWFDALLVFCSAYFGVMFAFASLRNMETLWYVFVLKQWLSNKSQAFSHVLRYAVLAVVFIANGFGIYIGRFLRFNSWDVWAQTSNLFLDIATRILNPLDHTRTWSFSFLYAAILFGMYLHWRSQRR